MVRPKLLSIGAIGDSSSKVYRRERSQEVVMRFSSLRRIAIMTCAAVLLSAQVSPQPAAVSCRKLSVNGSNIVPGSTLTVTVNGAAVGTHDQSASGELGPHMKAGLNRVGL